MADAMGNDGEKRESIGQVMKIWSRRSEETRTPREEGDDEELGVQARVKVVWDGGCVDMQENLECASDAGAPSERPFVITRPAP